MSYTSEKLEQLTHLVENWGDLWPSEVAEVHAFVGNNDAAFEWIDKALQQSQGAGWAESVLSPAFRNLRTEPRWVEFLYELNLAPEQLAEIHFEIPQNLLAST